MQAPISCFASSPSVSLHLFNEGVHVVFGHSSHHVKAVQRYHGGVIMYGCGDFIDDYEGIRNSVEQEEMFRGDLGCMYFVGAGMQQQGAGEEDEAASSSEARAAVSAPEGADASSSAATGEVVVQDVDLVPTQIKNLRVNYAHGGPDGSLWLYNTLKRECRRFGSKVAIRPDGCFQVL